MPASSRSNNTVSRELRPQGWSAERIKAALNDPAQLLVASRSADARAALELAQLRSAYRKGFQANFWLLAALTGLAFAITLFLMPQRSVDRKDDQEMRDRAIREIEEKKVEKRNRKKGSAGQAEEQESAEVCSAESGGGGAEVAQTASADGASHAEKEPEPPVAR